MRVRESIPPDLIDIMNASRASTPDTSTDDLSVIRQNKQTDE